MTAAQSNYQRCCTPIVLAMVALATIAQPSQSAAQSLHPVIDRVQPKIVKIYGAGGLRGLEAYQSGFLFSAEGHILSVFSYVLDSQVITVVLDDGRKYEAQMLGADPRLEVAVLKIDDEELPHFSLPDAAQAEAGSRVIAFSNLFGVATGDEPASVMQGVVSIRAPLSARRGSYPTPYTGPVYVLDAITNNPGAAGGALTNPQGELLGMLGKELRNSQNNMWLNYAIPINELMPSVDDIIAGKVLPREADDAPKAQQPLQLAQLGMVLVPDVLQRTPPYVDLVRDDSPAGEAGIRPDDLVIFVNDRLIQSCKMLLEELEYLEFDAPVDITVMREQELLQFTLDPEIN